MITIDTKMPYFHVRITQRGKAKDAIELNLLEKDLLRLILEKYRLREKFACGNELVNPANVIGIKITKSEKPLALDHPDDFRLEYRDLWRRLEDQEDVTKEFVEFIPKPTSLSKNVFIVHGRNHKPMKKLKAMLKKFGLNPIVLHEQPSGSITLIEKLERHSNVDYAFVILTPDDVGALRRDIFGVPMKELLNLEEELNTLIDTIYNREIPIWAMREHFSQWFKNRPRQNVVLEFGYFIGRLGRDRVCCLYQGDIELPSDMQGIAYIPFKDSVEEARSKIVKELKAAGYEIRI